MENYVHTLGNLSKKFLPLKLTYTYEMNRLNVSFVLEHLRQMNVISFVEKNRRDPQIQKKNSCWVVGGQLSNIL